MHPQTLRVAGACPTHVQGNTRLYSRADDRAALSYAVAQLTDENKFLLALCGAPVYASDLN